MNASTTEAEQGAATFSFSEVSVRKLMFDLLGLQQTHFVNRHHLRSPLQHQVRRSLLLKSNTGTNALLLRKRALLGGSATAVNFSETSPTWARRSNLKLSVRSNLIASGPSGQKHKIENWRSGRTGRETTKKLMVLLLRSLRVLASLAPRQRLLRNLPISLPLQMHSLCRPYQSHTAGSSIQPSVNYCSNH